MDNAVRIAVSDSVSSHLYVYEIANGECKETQIKTPNNKLRVMALQFDESNNLLVLCGEKVAKNSVFSVSLVDTYQNLSLCSYKFIRETPKPEPQIIDNTQVLESISELQSIVESGFMRIEKMLMSLSTRVANIERQSNITIN
jgi:hypothetical protein